MKKITEAIIPVAENTRVVLKKYSHGYNWSISLSENSTREHISKILELIQETDNKLSIKFNKTEENLSI